MPRTTIKSKHRDLLHPVLVADAAETATALGDALLGEDVTTGRVLRERLEAELALLDAFVWTPRPPHREAFELNLPATQLARAVQRLHRIGVELVAERNLTASERRTREIEADYDLGLRVVLLSTYLLADLPLKLLTETSEPLAEVC